MYTQLVRISCASNQLRPDTSCQPCDAFADVLSMFGSSLLCAAGDIGLHPSRATSPKTGSSCMPGVTKWVMSQAPFYYRLASSVVQCEKKYFYTICCMIKFMTCCRYGRCLIPALSGLEAACRICSADEGLLCQAGPVQACTA